MPAGAILLILFIAFLWGGHPVAVKLSFRGLPPMGTAGLRFLTALVVLLIYSWIKRIPLAPKMKEVLPLLILGAVFAAQIVTFTWGTFLTRAGRASTLINTYPLFVGPLAHLMIPGDSLTKWKSVGLICGFAGIFVVFQDSFFGVGLSFWQGDSLMVLSAFFLALLTVLIKRLVRNIEPSRLLISEMVVGIPVFFILSFLLENWSQAHVSPIVAAAVVYQGAVIGGFAFIGWVSTLKRYSATRVSVLFFTTPLWGVILSRIILGEPLTPWLAVGAVFVAIGIYISNLNSAGKRRTGS